MSSEILISVLDNETRVALRENQEVVELYIERNTDRGLVGNVYLGRVVRVLPGMQAAFVDIGIERAAFLYVAEIVDEFAGLDVDEKNEGETSNLSSQVERNISELLHEGKQILVQVAKDPLGTKGARLTANISLPGRNLVYMPTMEHIGVSKRIENKEERDRLKELVTALKKEEGGFIIRTVCEGKEAGEIAADVDYLRELWWGIQADAKDKKAPKLIHQDLDLPLKAVRDLTTLDTQRVIVDNVDQCERIEHFASRFMASLELKVEPYKGPDTLFDAYGIDKEIDQALSRKVWLKSGGYIIIDQTEALVAIDVNTGKFVGKGNLEETILKTNLEAVHEIAYQIRLRNIGGIIIIDFIDMQKEASREKIFSALEEALKKDKAKTNLGKISEFGILEMTRKRTRANLNDVMTESCEWCEGRGFIKSKESICMEICRLIRKRVKRNPLHKNFKVSAHLRIIDILLSGSQYIENLQNEFDLKIELNAEQSYYFEQYEVVEDNRTKREISINQPGEEEL